jgi:carbon-monoxide dehydrogenase medium subunit
MREFEFLEPTSVAQASRMLADLGDDCRVMAGGTALMLALRQRLLMPPHIISIAQIESLRGIDFDPKRGLRIGALARHADIASSPVVQRYYPMLASMAAGVANPQVRNQGTLGGNLCYGDPATDPPACLLALGAKVVLSTATDKRVIPIKQFFVDYFETDIDPDELLTEVRIPVPQPNERGLYMRFLRTPADHRPLVNIALVLRMSDALCVQAQLAVGATTVVARHIPEAEEFLAGKIITADVVQETATIVASAIEETSISDQRGSVDFRRDMTRIVAQRAIEQAAGLSHTFGAHA